MPNQENEPQNGSSSAKTVFLVVGIIIGVIVIGGIIALVVFWDSLVKISDVVQESKTSSSVSSLLPSEGLADSTGYKPYDNRTYGYTIYYPPEWKQSEDTTSKTINIYSDTSDTASKGVKVSITPVGDESNYTEIEEYISAQPEDSLKVQLNSSVEYSNTMGVKAAATEQANPKMRMYSWICGGQIVKMTYEGADFDKYLPEFNAMLEKMVLCAG